MSTTAEANRLIAYHSDITRAMTAERTSLESALIPVSAYIVISAIECWFRHPDVVRTIDAAMPADQIALAGHHPGMQINPVYLWSVANIFLTGRKVLTAFQMAEDDAESVRTVLEFWERAALAYRRDGHRQAWDAGFVVRPYGDEIVAELLDGVRPVGPGDERTRITRFNATLMAYLFLLYFDTRVGTGDSGPYPLPDGRTLLVRDFYRMSTSDFWWSDVAADVPYHNLTAALVLDDSVKLKVNDWGTSITEPEDYLDHLSGFGLFTTDTPDRSLRPVPLDEIDGIVAEVRKAQAQHYRNVAAMTRDEKIRCGAYVYFTFPRPFAEVAGVADQIDWEVPKVSVERGWYDMIAAMEGGNAPPPDPNEPYYPPIAGVGGVITRGDDYPIHQTSRPVRDPGPQRNLYDRFFFNGYPRSGDCYFAVAFGLYPGRNVMDAGFSVVADGVQHNLRVSRLLGDDRLDTRVGGIAVTIVEPLRVLRLEVDDPESGLRANLEFTARTPAYEEAPYFWQPGYRVSFDYTRLTQCGTWSGEITVPGGRVLHVSPDEWWGSRDRSWGVRPVGEREAAAPEGGPLGFYWLWAPVQFDDAAYLWDVNETPDGQAWHQEAIASGVGGIDLPVERGTATYDFEYKPGTRHAAGFTLSLSLPSRVRTLTFSPLFNFYMLGIGYGHPTEGHGYYLGESFRGFDTLTTAEVDETIPFHQHIQALCQVTRDDGAEGIGILEQLIFGAHAPSGLKDLLDMHP